MFINISDALIHAPTRVQYGWWVHYSSHMMVTRGSYHMWKYFTQFLPRGSIYLI